MFRTDRHEVVPVRVARLPDPAPQLGVWEGAIEGDSLSNASFAAVGTAVVGLITTADGNFYRLSTLGGGQTVVESFGPGATLRMPMPTAELVDSDTVDCEIVTRGARVVGCEVGKSHTINVLVLYTNDARDGTGGEDYLSAWLNLVQSRTNQSFRQSGVRHRIELVGRQLVENYESRRTKWDLENIRTGAEAFTDVPQSRQDYGGDVVVLLVNNDRDPAQACQFLPETRGTTAFSEAAFAVVPVQWMMLGDVFTHELGHLLGASHGGGFCGAGVESCPPLRTIMVRDGCANGASVLYWSHSPDLRPGPGCPLGRRGVYDNANAINEAGCTVAGYR